MTTSVKKNCVIVVRNAGKESPVVFRWKRGEEEILIVGQYTRLSAEVLNEFASGAHMNKIVVKNRRR